MKCPTEAIRVIHGKAILNPDRCIDCGECYRICPYGAISVRQDDFEKIYNYKYRVALMPAVFSAQFPDKITSHQIYRALISIGFTHVFETENSVEFLVKPYNDYVKNQREKPVISSFCPAIVRLIQVRFPTLVDNIMLIKPPMDVTALYIKKIFEDSNIPSHDIGIFYVTPCAAKIAGIKSSVLEDHSLINGVINMSYLYNKVYREIKQKGFAKEQNAASGFKFMTRDSVRWSLTKGEIRVVKTNKKLAIDQIENVIDFLEKLENEDIRDIDFLELRACYQSCAGGILCSGNKFLTTERANRRANDMDEAKTNQHKTNQQEIKHYAPYIEENVLLHGKILPRSIIKLDDNMAEAMKKMKRIHEINNILPQVDCGICGAPSCQAFAEDMVQKGVEIKSCIFIQKILEQNDKLDTAETIDLMIKTWGIGKLDKSRMKELNNEINI
jgi:Fe-S-cluster-containing hydrogenase component 2